jgi:hypothetical protein
VKVAASGCRRVGGGERSLCRTNGAKALLDAGNGDCDPQQFCDFSG